MINWSSFCWFLWENVSIQSRRDFGIYVICFFKEWGDSNAKFKKKIFWMRIVRGRCVRCGRMIEKTCARPYAQGWKISNVEKRKLVEFLCIGKYLLYVTDMLASSRILLLQQILNITSVSPSMAAVFQSLPLKN